jgi:hypothetical protein
LENTQGSLQSWMPGSNSETRRGSCVMVWAAISWYSILLVPLLPFMAELLQGYTWTGWVTRCIPWSGRCFRTTIRFSRRQCSHSHSWNCSVMDCRAWTWTSTSSLASTITNS